MKQISFVINTAVNELEHIKLLLNSLNYLWIKILIKVYY